MDTRFDPPVSQQMMTSRIQCAGRRLLLTLIVLVSGVAGAEENSSIAYVPPLLGSADAVVGAGSRGTQLGELTLCALAPQHVGLSNRASPTLYWFSSVALSSGPRLQLVELGSERILLETSLPPVAAGVHQIILDELDVSLRPGIDYRWSLSMPVSGVEGHSELQVSGYIRYQPSSAALSARTNGVNAADLPVILASSGVWYDAIWLLSELIRGNPDEPRFRAQRAALLETVPLPVAVAYDRQAIRP